MRQEIVQTTPRIVFECCLYTGDMRNSSIRNLFNGHDIFEQGETDIYAPQAVISQTYRIRRPIPCYKWVSMFDNMRTYLGHCHEQRYLNTALALSLQQQGGHTSVTSKCLLSNAQTS